ncbi:MAG TPA: hypothetical protein VF515_04610 [Candidatus Binatia bacterium]
MLPQLEALLRASPKVASFHVVDNDPIDEANFLFKLRNSPGGSFHFQEGSNTTPIIAELHFAVDGCIQAEHSH